jgi:hypothetical protein
VRWRTLYLVTSGIVFPDPEAMRLSFPNVNVLFRSHLQINKILKDIIHEEEKNLATDKHTWEEAKQSNWDAKKKDIY